MYPDISVDETPDRKYGHSDYVRVYIGPSRRGGYSREGLKAMTPVPG